MTVSISVVGLCYGTIAVNMEDINGVLMKLVETFRKPVIQLLCKNHIFEI